MSTTGSPTARRTRAGRGAQTSKGPPSSLLPPRPPAPAGRPGSRSSRSPRASPSGPDWCMVPVIVSTHRPGAAARVGRRPSRRGGEPDRQPGRHGDRAAAVEGQHVLGGRPARAPPARTTVNSSGRSRRRRSAVAVTRSLALPASSTAGRRRPGAGAQQLARGLEVDRPAVVGVDQALLPQLAALVDVRHAGDRQRDQLGRQRVRPARHRSTCAEQLLEHRRDLRVVEGRVDRGVHGRLVVRRPGAVQVVRSPASRIAFSAYAVQPLAVDRPGADARPARAGSEARVGQRGQLRAAGPAPSAQRPGISASAVMRARTSSPRLVSCVESVVIACGQSLLALGLALVEAAHRPARRPSGSPPTSLSEVSRGQR